MLTEDLTLEGSSLIEEELSQLFGANFVDSLNLKNALTAIIYSQGTSAYRLNLIKNSGFSPEHVAYLLNINAGITVGSFEYSPTLEKYPHILKIINIARKGLQKDTIPDGRRKTSGTKTKVSDLLTM